MDEAPGACDLCYEWVSRAGGMCVCVCVCVCARARAREGMIGCEHEYCV
jgi:hypothetical protein